MFFLPKKYRLLAILANVLEKIFPQRVMSSVDNSGWLVFYQPVRVWEESLPEERCECNPLHVCSACRERYDRERQMQGEFAPIPF